ncbi:MAG: hypothetical protein IKU93_07670 [Alistipes sp.]|nr:hypothetical protein [Alistipes sp.]
MKRCENCKKTFADTVNFCTDCGQPLVSVPDAPQAAAAVNATQPAPKKKRSIWKILLITVAVIVVGFFALVNHLMNAATYLRVEPNLLVAAKSGGEAFVDIDYDGYVWTINHIPDWVDVEEYEDSFKVYVGPNFTGYDREGSITVQSGDFLAQVLIQQNGKATYIKTSESSLHFVKDGGEAIVQVDTDGCDYTVEYPDYLTVSIDDDTFTVTAPRNTGVYRSGKLTVYEDNVKTRINFTQGGKCNNCGGDGRVSCSSCWGNGGWSYGFFYSSCGVCGGNGTLKCGTCRGTGYRE